MRPHWIMLGSIALLAAAGSARAESFYMKCTFDDKSGARVYDISDSRAVQDGKKVSTAITISPGLVSFADNSNKTIGMTVEYKFYRNTGVLTEEHHMPVKPFDHVLLSKCVTIEKPK